MTKVLALLSVETIRRTARALLPPRKLGTFLPEDGFLSGVLHIWRATDINPPIKRGGISVSGIALIILAAHKCAFYWPASHATVTYAPLERV